MPAEFLREEEDFEEDTLFDQAGLLTNKIKQKSEIRSSNPTMRITPMKTFALCLAFFGLGLSTAILEPTLLDLQHLAGTDVRHISYTISARSAGLILGSILGFLLFERYNRQFLLFLIMLAMAILLGVLPWCHNLIGYIIIMIILGTFMQMLLAGGNVLCLDLWGRQSGPFLQAIHFSLALGLFISPFLCNAILAGKAGISASDSPRALNINNSYALALPASTLFSVQIIPLGKHSRHSRHPREIDETEFEFSNTNITNSTNDALSVTMDTNATSEIGLIVNNTTPTTPVFNLTTVQPNSTGNGSVAVQNVTSSPFVITPEANATKFHKPKPDKTDAGLLPAPVDPWNRPKPDTNVPPTTSTIAPKTLLPTTVAPVVANDTNQTMPNATMTNATATDATATDATAINTTAANATAPNATVISQLSTVEEITTQISIENQTNSTNNSTSTTVEDAKLTTANSTVSNASTDNHETTTTSTQTIITTTTTVSPIIIVNKSASTTEIPLPETTIQTQSSITVATELPTSHNPSTTTTTTSSTTSSTTTTTTVPTSIPSTTLKMDTTSSATLKQTVADGNISVSNVSENVNNELMETDNVVIEDSSEENNNSTTHRKPVTAFNNQTDDGQLLLSDLLNKISELGVTKVHIVYAAMSIIVLLTSVVFLSFLCHNPRELRSKQGDVRDTGQEGKFASVMTAIFFIFMMFYSGAELIFSQLYLSLVLQSSVHLLRTRGSLLISVFWGVYTFSRGTSICCTNGFKPATMLLVDFSCCIVSAITLVIFGPQVESILWCSVAVMAIGLSSILPYCLLWLEDYIHISNKTACAIFLGNSIVHFVLSFLYGHPISLSSTVVIYLVLACCVFALLLFGVAWRLATWRGDKYKYSKTNVKYQLANQMDEDDDTVEMPSGSSSLYLLNNETSHSNSDNLYLPLKQKKNLWK